MLFVFLEGGRPHAAKITILERGFQQVGRIHGPARGRTCANHRVDFVDEKDPLLEVLHFLHDRLQPLFEITAIPRSRKQRAHIE